MKHDSEKYAKRILALGVLLSSVGLLSLIIIMMQQSEEDSSTSLEVPEERTFTLEEKAEILASLRTSSNPAEIPEEDKLKILESLNVR